MVLRKALEKMKLKHTIHEVPGMPGFHDLHVSGIDQEAFIKILNVIDNEKNPYKIIMHQYDGIQGTLKARLRVLPKA